MSKRGVYYEAANGAPIMNEGEKDIKGESENGEPLGMTFQVAGVKGPLASVKRICQAGNLVIFDDKGGVIVNTETRNKTQFTMNDKGVYTLNLWVNRAGFPRQGQ